METELELISRAQDGDRVAVDTLIKMHDPFVKSIVRRYTSGGGALGADDMLQEGRVGLLEAIEGFDPEYRASLITYAYHKIRMKILKAISDQGYTVRIPRDLRYAASRHARGLELSKTIKYSIEQIESVSLGPATSLPVVAEPGGIGIDTLESDSSNTPTRIGEESDMIRHIDEILDLVDKRRAYILRNRFGLNGEVKQTLKELGDRLGISPWRVKMLEKSALEQLEGAAEKRKLDKFIDA